MTELTDRRTVLRAAGATALGASVAGCTGLGASDDAEGDDLVLPPPETGGSSSPDLPYPTYGDELPEATVPAPLHDRTVTTTEFVGERHAMLTFVFTSCTTVCPGLTAALRHVQADATDRGYGDDVAFLVTTFDPEYDTADVLRSYGEDFGVNYDAGNWYFLRPESPERATEVVTDRFGVAFDRRSGGSGAGGNETADTGGHQRHFVHLSLVLLVNQAGLVERAYTTDAPPKRTVVEDARSVVEGW
jgi:protein SCO1/2